MASIYDVAKKAGVSKTLVSRVINQQKGVGEQSRKRIEQAMKELNYHPSAIARSLVLQKTNIIGVIIDTLCEPFFFEFIRGIEQVIEESGYEVIFCSARNKLEAKVKYIDFFSQGRVDGYIVYGSNINDTALLDRLEQSIVPSVVVENDVQGKNINNICVDNHYGSEKAVTHLLERGCRNICHVTGDADIGAAIHRKEGFINTMIKHGFQIKKDMIIQAGFSVKEGFLAVSDLLSKKSSGEFPDGIYFGADNTAAGGMMALLDQGIRIPEDVKIVGFDNDQIYVPDRILKKLTTLSQPMFEMGSSAARILIDDICNNPVEKKKLIYYPELLVKETT